MFAIAIWDGRTNRLVLARDRLGKKPMYWRPADHRLSYGSELKAILEDGEFERVVDREALELFLQYQYVPAPWSILKGVAKLPPASRPDLGRRRAGDRALLDARVRARRPAAAATRTPRKACRSSARRSASACAATSRWASS